MQAHIDALNADDTLAISVITEAEVRYGLARKPEAHRLARTVEFVLAGLTILPWTSATAHAYASLRVENQRLGLVAGSLDLLIAAFIFGIFFFHISTTFDTLDVAQMAKLKEED